jgi:hypothetical protein
MPSTDNILRIGAEFDVGPLVTGTQQVVASFDQMKARLEQFATAADAAGKPIDAQAARILALGLSSKQTELAIGQLGLSQKEATALTETLTSVLMGNNDAMVAMQAAARTATVAEEEQISAHRAAKMEVAALEGRTGMLVRQFEMLAAESGTLGPMLQAAFPIFAIVGFLQILGEVFESIDNISNALGGFGKEVQKQYAEAVEWNRKLITFNMELADKQAAIGVIGKEGAAKYGAEVQNTHEHLARLRDRQTEVTKELSKGREELEKFAHSGEGMMGDTVIGFLVDPAVREHIEEVKKSVAALGKEQETLYLQMRTAPVDTAKKEAEERTRLNSEAIANDKARTKAEEEIGLARVAQRETWAREEYNVAKASDQFDFAEQRTPQMAQEESLRESEQTKYDIKTAARAKNRADVVREGATGKDVRGELATIDAEQVTAVA